MHCAINFADLLSGVGRARLEAGGGAVSEDARDGIAATVVLAEDLAEEPPDGGDGTEQSVAVVEAVLMEGIEDAAFAQGVGEGQSLVARKAGADLVQGGHGWLSTGSGGSGTDPESAAAEPSPDKG